MSSGANLAPVESTALRAHRPAAGATLGGAPATGWPIKVGVVMGLLVLALEGITWGRWILGDNFRANDPGPDAFGGGDAVLIHAIEYGMLGVGLGILAWFVVRPLVRERVLTFDGILALCGVTIWFWDPLDNAVNFTFNYNAHLTNFSSWGPLMPGWLSPNMDGFGEPPIFMLGGTLGTVIGCALLGSAVIRRCRARFPGLGPAGAVIACFVALSVASGIAELTFCLTGVYAYVGVVESLSLWAGTQHQFPMYEPFLFGFWATGIAVLRHGRDDRGLSFAERGAMQLRIGPKLRKSAQFLSIVGFINVWFVFGYFVPYNAFAVRVDSFPALPSYLRSGICGTGTDYACPNRYMPIPRKGTVHFRPDDPRLPLEIRERQGLR